MTRIRRRTGRKANGHSHRNHQLELTLRTASLGSPIFQESWSAGAPLNWVEFVQRGRMTRTSTRQAKGVRGEE